VTFDKPFDPREQDIEDRDTGTFRMAIPFVTDPVHVQALKGNVPADTCAGCGLHMGLHYDTSGIYLIGCTGALKRQQLGLTEIRGFGVPGDAHPAVSRRLQWALETDCGATAAALMEALDCDSRLRVGRILAEHAVQAYLMSEGKD